ncbi:MAG: Asp23/Gls24 family envelope stress response protein [Firmicutes bacterium]|nr:Asp23/Gls24 family envelope stress response protein [Bacillota bacterium]
MLRTKKQLNSAGLSREQFNEIIGNAVISCYGVAGMANSNARQGLRLPPRRGDIRVHCVGKGLVVSLRILTVYGLSISAVTRGVAARVRYIVDKATGLRVSKVNVFIDGIIRKE